MRKKKQSLWKALEPSHRMDFFQRWGLKVGSPPTFHPSSSICALFSVPVSCSPVYRWPLLKVGWESKRASSQRTWTQWRERHRDAGRLKLALHSTFTSSALKQAWRQEQVQAHHQARRQRPAADPCRCPPSAWLQQLHAPGSPDSLVALAVHHIGTSGGWSVTLPCSSTCPPTHCAVSKSYSKSQSLTIVLVLLPHQIPTETESLVRGHCTAQWTSSPQ